MEDAIVGSVGRNCDGDHRHTGEPFAVVKPPAVVQYDGRFAIYLNARRGMSVRSESSADGRYVLHKVSTAHCTSTDSGSHKAEIVANRHRRRAQTTGKSPEDWRLVPLTITGSRNAGLSRSVGEGPPGLSPRSAGMDQGVVKWGPVETVRGDGRCQRGFYRVV